MRADVQNRQPRWRRPAAPFALLVAAIALAAPPAAVAQPAATDQYVEEQPSGPGTDPEAAPAPSPPPASEPVLESPGPAAEAAPQPDVAPQRPRAENYIPPALPGPVRDTVLPLAEDDGGSGTLWLGGYGVTPFVFSIAAALAACLAWRLGTAGAARLRAD